MKKLVMVMLLVCMMLTTVALGEGVLLQDEMPPVVVTAKNAAGEVIAARICDAEGNVLAEIKDDGSMVLTDVHQRTEVENEIIAVRLTSAYEGVMEDVHHSDVECRLHDHDVKVEINEILASMQHEMDAHDLVMYELFDVMTSEEATALLVDGSYIELTLELKEEQGLPLIVLFSHNGTEWQVIPYTEAGDNRFTVKLEENGTIALLSNSRETMGVGQEAGGDVVIIPGKDDEDMNNFTPSVSGKPAPEIITFKGEDDVKYIGYIRNDVDDTEILVPDYNYVIVAAVSERDYIIDIQTHEHLEWSFDSILGAKDVGELYTEHDMSVVIPDHEHGTIAGALDEVLAELGEGLTHDQLVVKDLFEVTAYGDYVHYLYDENYYLEVTFDAKLDPEKELIVIHSPDSKHWHIHPVEEYEMDEQGYVTLKMYDLGTVAFLVNADEYLNTETAVQSPN